MKRVLIAAAVVAAFVQPSLAGNRENAMHHIAQVTAAASLCHSIEPQPVLMALVANANGVDMNRDQPEMLRDALQLKAKMANLPEEAVCESALALYGPGGRNVSGLVKKK